MLCYILSIENKKEKRCPRKANNYGSWSPVPNFLAQQLHARVQYGAKTVEQTTCLLFEVALAMRTPQVFGDGVFTTQETKSALLQMDSDKQ